MSDTFSSAGVVNIDKSSHQSGSLEHEALCQQPEALFRQMFEVSADAMLLLENGVFIDCNQAAVDMMRCSSKAELLSLQHSQMSPKFQPDGRLSSEKAKEIIAAIPDGGSHRFEWMHRRLDGEEFWVEVLLTRLKLGERQILYTTWREIGERKRLETDRRVTEAALQQKEAQYRTIFETINDGILITDLENGQTIEVNPAAHRMCGYSYEEFARLRLTDLVHPDSQPFFADYLKTVRAGDCFSCEAIALHKDGTPINLEVTAIPFFLNQKPYGLSVIRDVTERKRLEAERENMQTALQQAEAYYRGIFETINDGIDITDLETGKSVALNPAFCKMHGYTIEEFLQLTPEDYVHPDYLPEFDRFIETIKRGDRFFCKAIDVCKDGTLIDVEVTAIPFSYNEKLHALCVVRDVSDRKATEAALEQANILVNTVLETVPGILFAKDLQGRYLVSNSNLSQFFGKPIPEILGKTDAELVSPEVAAYIEPKDRKIFAEQVTQTFEEFFGDRTYLTTKAPLYSAQGELIGLVGLSFDISDRKAAEQAQARLIAILEATSDVVGIADMQGNTLYLNAAGQRLLEISTKEGAVGSPIDTLHPEEKKRVFIEQAIPTAIQQGIWQGESVILTRSGKELPVSQVIIAHKSADGTPEFLSTIIRDITEQKQAEAALKQRTKQERLLNRITRRIRDTLNFDAILTTTVREIRNVLTVDRCGFSWYYSETNEWDTITESKLPELPPLIGSCSAASTGTLPQQMLNLETVRVNDVEHWPDLQLRDYLRSIGAESSLILPLKGRSGVVGIITCDHGQVRQWSDDEVKLLQAVTEQLAIALNQAELYTQSQAKAQELEQALDELQRAQLRMIQSEKMSSLGQLVAGVAHEINNPVNFIYGNISPANEYTQDLLNLVNLYQTYYPNPVPAIQEEIEEIDLEFVKQDLPRLLASMRIGADRIRQIVGSLRTFSRLDEAAYKAVDIHDGIESTLVILENRLKVKPDRPAVQVIKQYGKLPLVECYAGQLNQVFMNILTNALDALDERDQTRSQQEMQEFPSSIQIHTEVVEPNLVTIRIIDNGPGMPESVKNRIFDPFFTTKPIGKGTGIGMSISYQIVTENHGGTLECISTPGSGTEFVITIPQSQRGGRWDSEGVG